MRSIVIGADGAIGSALVTALSGGRHSVYRTTRRRVSKAGNVIYLDLAAAKVDDELSLPEVDVVFFCAGVTSFAACRTNFELARCVNVIAPTAIARRVAAAGARVILLSSSAVFDWTVEHSIAERVPCPETVYGKLKAEAEAEFISFGKAATILRLTKVLTLESNLFNDWLDKLKQGMSVTAYSDLHMAPVTLHDVTSALLAISESRGAGVFQVSGSYDISYYEAARYLAARIGADPKLVRAVRARDRGVPPEEIIRFSSLDTSRITALTGWIPPDPYGVLDTLFRLPEQSMWQIRA